MRGRSNCGQVLMNPQHVWASQRLAELEGYRCHPGYDSEGGTELEGYRCRSQKEVKKLKLPPPTPGGGDTSQPPRWRRHPLPTEVRWRPLPLS